MPAPVRAAVACLLALACVAACSRREKEKPSEGTGALQSAAQRLTPLDGGGATLVVVDGGVPGIVVELAPGGEGPAGITFTSTEKIPQDVHLRLQLVDAQGAPLATDRLVVACVPRSRPEGPTLIPTDPGLDEDARAALRQAVAVRVVSVTAGAGCLRPTLRLETLRMPRLEQDAGVP
ncbi:MAG: hypothetical protein AB2A00_24830 [Myxococcota bacterium]